MIRLILCMILGYLIFSIYRKYQDSRIGLKSNDTGKENVFFKSSCPSPKTFIDYTEGRIKGARKKAIDRHISHCKECQGALKGVFGMSSESGQKQEKQTGSDLK